jgi:hypothetical protein
MLSHRLHYDALDDRRDIEAVGPQSGHSNARAFLNGDSIPFLRTISRIAARLILRTFT